MNISTRRRPLLSYFRPFTWNMTSLSGITVPRGLYEIQIASTSDSGSNGAIITFYLKISDRITFNFESRAGGTAGCGASNGRNSYYTTIPFSDQCIFYRSIAEARAKTKLYQDGNFRIGVGGKGGDGGGNYTNGSSVQAGGGGGGGAGINGTGTNGTNSDGNCNYVGGHSSPAGGYAGNGGPGQILYYLDGSVACSYGVGGGAGSGASADGGTVRSGGSYGSGAAPYIGMGQGGNAGPKSYDHGGTDYVGKAGGGQTGNYSGSFKFTGKKLKRF